MRVLLCKRKEEQTVCEADRERESAGLRVSLAKGRRANGLRSRQRARKRGFASVILQKEEEQTVCEADRERESAGLRVSLCKRKEEQTVCEADRERESAGLRVSLCKRKEEQISDKINDQTEVICRE